MGFRLFPIFVTKQRNTDVQEVLQKLNLGDYKPGGTVDFYASNKPETLFVGKFEDVLIICDPNLVYAFSHPTPTATEQRFIECFPEAEITALSINETSDAYGFAVIQNGIRMRTHFAEDQEVTIDYGEPLPEEILVREEDIFEEEEIAEMMEEEELDEEEIQNRINMEAGFRTAVRLSARYIGTDLFSIPEDRIRLVKYDK